MWLGGFENDKMSLACAWTEIGVRNNPYGEYELL